MRCPLLPWLSIVEQKQHPHRMIGEVGAGGWGGEGEGERGSGEEGKRGYCFLILMAAGKAVYILIYFRLKRENIV